MPRPKQDGMLTRWNVPVMNELVKLVPDFDGLDDEKEAETFYKKIQRRAKFKRMAGEHLETSLPEYVRLSGYDQYRCTNHVQYRWQNLTLRDGRHNPMEVLHLMAHYLQPSDSKWHGGEFGKLFLELVAMMFGPEMKRVAKDILIDNGIRTSVRSEETREKQRDAYYRRKHAEMPARMLEALKRAEKLGT